MINKNEKNEIDLIQYWRITIKRKWVVIIFTTALLFFTAVFTFLATPMYKSTATLHIDEDFSKILSIEDAFGYQTRFRDQTFFNTQLRLIRSKRLAERVVERMDLLSRPEFSSRGQQNKSLVRSVYDLLTFKWISSKDKEEKRQIRPLYPSSPYSNMADVLRRRIGVSPIRETKLVEVSFTSPSPVLAADIVNTLAEEFINFSVDIRYEKTQEATDFLGEQIANTRAELESKERELLRYGKEKEIEFLSDTESAALNKFEDLTQAYTQAQMERYRTQAAYMELKNLEVDSIPPSVTNPTIQDIRTEYTRTKSEYDRKTKILGENYPEMVQLRAKLDSLKGELDTVVNDAETEYRAALRNENYLRESVESQRTEVARMSSDAILYNSLKIEVENKRKLLNSLVERQTETQVSSNLEKFKASNISIIDRGEVPKKPVSPNTKLNFLFALLIGFSGGVGLCILLEQLDNTVKGNEDVEKMFGISALGAIPLMSSDGMKKGRMNGYHAGYRYGYGNKDHVKELSLAQVKGVELVNFHYPQLSISEDYRTVRTSILLSHAETPPKVIVFTSAMAQEGKTTTVANMAVSFAQLEQRVLIIDADMRKPRIHKIFDVENNMGLSAYLTGKQFIRNAILETAIENVWLLPSGLIPPNPAELLNSKKMEELMSVVRKGYDTILIDTPPVLAVIDAVIASTFADSTILVVKSGKTTYKMLEKAIEEMKRSNTHINGVLFNELNVGKGEYRYMDYYSYNEYSYKSESDSEQTEDIDI